MVGQRHAACDVRVCRKSVIKDFTELLSPKLYEDIVNVTNRNLKEQEKGGED